MSGFKPHAQEGELLGKLKILENLKFQLLEVAKPPIDPMGLQYLQASLDGLNDAITHIQAYLDFHDEEVAFRKQQSKRISQ